MKFGHLGGFDFSSLKELNWFEGFSRIKRIVQGVLILFFLVSLIFVRLSNVEVFYSFVLFFGGALVVEAIFWLLVWVVRGFSSPRSGDK